jgi:hypothetical protein
VVAALVFTRLRGPAVARGCEVGLLDSRRCGRPPPTIFIRGLLGSRLHKAVQPHVHCPPMRSLLPSPCVPRGAALALVVF